MVLPCAATCRFICSCPSASCVIRYYVKTCYHRTTYSQQQRTAFLLRREFTTTYHSPWAYCCCAQWWPTTTDPSACQQILYAGEPWHTLSEAGNQKPTLLFKISLGQRHISADLVNVKNVTDIGHGQLSGSTGLTRT